MPLAYWISHFCGICVPIYLFLSGYGLYIVYDKGKPMHNVRRVSVLMLNVLLVSFIFFPLSYFVLGKGFDFSLCHLFLSITGIEPYNGEWWFLFPWVLICLVSKFLFRILESFNIKCVIALFFIIHLFLRFYVSQNMDVLCVMPWRIPYQIILMLMLSFPFLLGAISAKTGLLVVVTQMAVRNKLFLWGFMLVILLIKMFFFHSGVLDALIAVGFCCLIVTMKPNRLLMSLGKRSTNMWLVHTFFCYYYWHDFFESLTYPWVMFVVLVLYSYITACLIDYFFLPMKQGFLDSLKRRTE